MKEAPRLRHFLFTFIGIVTLYILSVAIKWRAQARESAPATKQLVTASKTWSMRAPNLPQLRATTSNVTVWLLLGGELSCGKYNYVCKFYYGIRCHMLGGFDNTRIAADVAEVKNRARSGDVVIILHRFKRSEPPALAELNEWRNSTSDASKLRVGVFHVANERNRTGWAWYPNADFVLRNYWLPDGFPGHVQYIPLHAQMPSACTPEAPTDPTMPKSMCTCGNLVIPRARNRTKLYSFSGSLRGSRAELLERIRASKVLKSKSGVISVSRSFGGDGKHPKIRHIKSILDSKFVFSPCGNVMETHRTYEALALGAIPVLENCEDERTNRFFPFRELVFDTHREMVEFVESFADDDGTRADALQAKSREWWIKYNEQITRNVTRLLTIPTPKDQIFAP